MKLKADGILARHSARSRLLLPESGRTTRRGFISGRSSFGPLRRRISKASIRASSGRILHLHAYGIRSESRRVTHGATPHACCVWCEGGELMSRAIQKGRYLWPPPMPVFKSVIGSWHHLRIQRTGYGSHPKARQSCRSRHLKH